LSTAASAHRLSPTPRASPLEGTWRVTAYQSCSNSPRNSLYCSILFGTGTAAVGISGTTLTEQFTETVAIDSRLHYTSHARDVLSERASSRAEKPNCTDEGYSVHLFNGTCRSHSVAKGLIKQSDLGRVADFWETESHVTLEGRHPYVVNNYATAGADTHLPAVAGAYTTRSYFELYRLLKPGAPLPAGVSIHIMVERVSPRAGG